MTPPKVGVSKAKEGFWGQKMLLGTPQIFFIIYKWSFSGVGANHPQVSVELMTPGKLYHFCLFKIFFFHLEEEQPLVSFGKFSSFHEING